MADELARADCRIHVLHRAGKLGLGTAILAGVRYALQEDYDLFVNMDADFSHHPRYLPALLAGMRRHDVMIGSRYVPGGGALDWPWSRRLMSGGINALVRLLLRIPARDSSGGYRIYLATQQYYVQLPSAVYVAVWDGALKNYGPNLGYDYGGRLMAAWLDR